jgi:hypothetical protein
MDMTCTSTGIKPCALHPGAIPLNQMFMQAISNGTINSRYHVCLCIPHTLSIVALFLFLLIKIYQLLEKFLNHVVSFKSTPGYAEITAARNGIFLYLLFHVLRSAAQILDTAGSTA